jgi:putative ABC transport system permease protein
MSYILRLYLRNLRKEKTRILNIISLAITITFALLILFLIQDELSYDKWNKNRKDIYRIETFEKWPAKTFNKATCNPGIGPKLKNEFPEIKSYVRFAKIRDPEIVIEDSEFNEESFYFADSSVFSIFPYELLAGSAEKALVNPNSIVLSRDLAMKYFRESNPLGKVIIMNGRNYTLTGIMDATPKSHLQCNALLSIQDTGRMSNNIKAYGGDTYTYVLTSKKTDIKDLQGKLPGFYDKYLKIEDGYDFQLMFEPLENVHFSSKKLENDLPTMNLIYIYILGALLVLTLAFSCLNYINLVIGNSVKTGKYIGINKIFGIKKGRVFAHFTIESLINVLLATGISLLLLKILIPQYNIFFDKDLSTNLFSNQLIVTNILFLFILLGIVPGIILASVFIPIKPLFILKDQYIKRSSMIRKVFIFLELSMFIIVLFGIIVINLQLYNLKNKSLGFDDENVLFAKIQDQELIGSASILKGALRKHPEVTEVASSDAGIGDDYWIASFNIELANEMKYFDLKRIVVDENFIDLYDIEVIQGRAFESQMRTDFQNCLINEAALNIFGVENSAINNPIRLPGKEEGKIIGVVRDFYFHSKHNEIEPLIICLAEEGGYTPLISVKFAKGQQENAIQTLSKEWEKFSPNSAISYTSAEEKIRSFYRNEERINTVFKWGVVLSFSIVCFGLISFVLFIIEQKSKEISIRKVNGASTYHIIKSVLLDEYLSPILISIATMLPLSYFVIEKGVQTMVTEVDVRWWMFILTIIFVLLTVFATTFVQLYRASNRNPLEALRYE